jgi:spore coat protein A
VSQATCTGGGGTYQGDGSACAGTYCPIVLTPYLDALPIPPIATPVSGSPGAAATYNLTAREFEQQFHTQLPPTRVWGYHDGISPVLHTPGPVVIARTGEPVTVNWINDLRDFATNALRTDHYLDVDTLQDGDGEVCIMGAEDNAKIVSHLHGGHVPAIYDGYPEDSYLPGDPPVPYIYPNNQQASYLWFHDHALGVTRLNVYMGLAGAYLVRDAVEDAINIPRGQYEVPLVIQDRKFNPDGTLSYPSMWMDHFFGDKIIVNGMVWPYLDVRRGKYLFRLLNGSTSRVYTLSLTPPSGALSFTVVGNEGGLLEAPAPGVGFLTIGPGERYDVVVDFAGYSNGTEILLTNSAAAPFPNGTVDEARVMKFRVTSQMGDTDPLPATLRPIVRIDPAEAVQTRDFRLKQAGTDGCGRQMWTINNLGWHDITEYPQLDTVEIWRFINDSGVSHPMHMHLVMFQILDRDGFTTGPGGTIIPNGTPQAPPAEERGWKDTAMVAPNQILRVIARFENYKGKYAYHCHILEHEEHEMMRQFQTISCGDGEIDPTEACDAGTANGTPTSCCSLTCTVVASGTACSDGNACTLNDQCLAGVCAPGTPIAAPAEASNLMFGSDMTSISWDPIPGAAPGTVYDVARGLVSQMPVGSGAAETCLAPGVATPSAMDDTAPPVGEIFWYFARGRHACGTGTYGYGALNGVPTTERVMLTCP